MFAMLAKRSRIAFVVPKRGLRLAWTRRIRLQEERGGSDYEYACPSSQCSLE